MRSLLCIAIVAAGLVLTPLAEAGRCTGSAYCAACKDCSACQHCHVLGGRCGVCGTFTASARVPPVKPDWLGLWPIVAIPAGLGVLSIFSKRKTPIC